MTANAQAAAGEILVGVDSSANAMRAADWAAAEAAARGASLVLVHATTVPEGPVFGPSDYPRWSRAHGLELLEGTAARVRTVYPDLSVRTERSDLPPAQVLTEMSRHADLVVTGTRGRGGFTGLLVGSVSRKLAAHAHCPLVVVPGGTPEEPISEVVVGLEPDQDGAPIHYAFAAAARYGAVLHAVRAWHPHALYSSVAGGYYEDLDQRRADEIRAVRNLLDRFATTYPAVKTAISTGRGNTVPILIEAARGTRLLVVGAHRHRGPLAVGVGYVADGLLAHSPTPVALVPIR